MALPVVDPQGALVIFAVAVKVEFRLFTVGVMTTLQPTASLTVTLYVPAARPAKIFKMTGVPPFKLYVYGAIPPVALTVIIPVFRPHKFPTVVAVAASVDEGTAFTVRLLGTDVHAPFLAVTE